MTNELINQVRELLDDLPETDVLDCVDFARNNCLWLMHTLLSQNAELTAAREEIARLRGMLKNFELPPPSGCRREIEHNLGFNPDWDKDKALGDALSEMNATLARQAEEIARLKLELDDANNMLSF
jgi:hypothetical protein